VILPEYIFEVSWEVCNKVGGIHTVVSTKANSLANRIGDGLLMIGPEVLRDSAENPEFIEDKNLFRSWHERAVIEGLPVRVGRWNIAGSPAVILLDFTSFISRKDEVLKDLWETYQLDSISGAWDYIEPALFGYASGKVIESFCRFNLTTRNRVIAQFHEWMTGAGILYLNQHVPQVATVFTTHATVVGRALAGNGYPLYKNLQQYDGDKKALEFNIIAKHSLEKISAHTADIFTTVSSITANECRQFLGKEVDLVTPNGFEDDFIPVKDNFAAERLTARNKLNKVAEALLGYKLQENTIFTGISGRYEFKNKGIDLFIEAISRLNEHSKKNDQIVAFILVPANHYGPRKDLLNIMATGEPGINTENKFLTHWLHDAEYDPVLKKIQKSGLNNSVNERVKIIFVPSYLNGNDGIFNLTYYKLLIGLDITVFPSYYEPWGYTPLESVAFSVPTITTSLSGFGLWVNRHSENTGEGVVVIERNEDNDEDVIKHITASINRFAGKNNHERQLAGNNAYQLSRNLLWNNFVNYYLEAYNLALGKIPARKEWIQKIQYPEYEYVKLNKTNLPQWKKTIVRSTLPENLKGLWEIAKNLWWSWNYEAKEIFESFGEEAWSAARYNPLRLLESLSYDQIIEFGGNQVFMEKYHSVHRKFRDYMNVSPPENSVKIAYFSMEYGFNDNLKIFSGGLGILAGDYLKQASDSNLNLTGIGLLYRSGYFRQTISLSGEQLAKYTAQHFSQLPITPVKDEEGNWKKIGIAFAGRTIYSKIWEVNVGRIKLFLLDTDFDDNSPGDRSITHQLYGGNEENRFRQEMLLGIGGIRALKILNIEPHLYHCNEGHAAFTGMERLRQLIVDKNLSFTEALEVVRASSLFTTHTPVPAGHDLFTEDLMRTYMSHYPSRLNIDWVEFLNLGKLHPEDRNERFSMSYLAANLSQEINGVSRMHGKVSRGIFSKLWSGYYPEENHVGYITNGVHYPTWTAREWRKLYESEFSNGFQNNQSDKSYWEKIYSIPDEKIWKLRFHQRKMLTDYIKERITRSWIQRHDDPKKLIEINNSINANTLTIGFARRFATYKRAYLLFKDIRRLKKIVSDPECPVQFIFAGKAHPNDGAGQAIIKQIVEYSNHPDFIGRIIFLENYDIQLAKKMVSGVDVWLNTPSRPLEASGTSGMKAVLNGVLHFSVLDGWWVEGYKENAGWALPEKQTYENLEFQDELDAEVLYSILENEIIPLFYKYNGDNIPRKWVQYIKNSIARIAPEFTAKRMLDDYCEKYYNKLYLRTIQMSENDYGMAKKIAAWKKKFSRGWESIEIISVNLPDAKVEPLSLGKIYHSEVVIDLNEISENDLGVELVTGIGNDTNIKILSVNEFELKKVEDKKAYYEIKISLIKAGMLHFGIRIFPKNPMLPHRQDFCFVKWI
jgi:phosphorylase/glycogen(starch) synthase